MKTTAIIVLHFGEVENTLRCLNSIQKIKNLDSSKVFIVDNGTGKLKENHLKEFRFQYMLIKNERNLGYAGGNNVGIRKALKENYKYVFLLNNDAVVQPTIIFELQKPLQSRKIGIAGCIVTYDANRNKIWFAGGKLNENLCITRHINMNTEVTKLTHPESKPDFISGAAMMIKREVFDAIGLIPENYFLYWEDVDFCFLARKNKYMCYLVNKPLVSHSVSASSGEKGSNTLSPLRAYYYARNPFIFMARHRINFIMGLFGQLIIRFPYSLLSMQSFQALTAYLRGIYDGIGAFMRYNTQNKGYTNR